MYITHLRRQSRQTECHCRLGHWEGARRSGRREWCRKKQRRRSPSAYMTPPLQPCQSCRHRQCLFEGKGKAGGGGDGLKQRHQKSSSAEKTPSLQPCQSCHRTWCLCRRVGMAGEQGRAGEGNEWSCQGRDFKLPAPPPWPWVEDRSAAPALRGATQKKERKKELRPWA